MQHKMTTALELEIVVFAHVSPAVAPRPCSNPDDPAYSDPGDPGERSVEAVFLKDLRPNAEKPYIDITDALTQAQLDELAEQAYQEVSDS